MKFSEDQQRVIDSRGRNLLVSAAAGSGKTAVLVERILSLITDKTAPVDLDRILVVTFTVAAAGEMKDRISAALEKKLEEGPENEDLRHQAVLVHHAQVGTIHSFCSYIIRNYFYRLDIDPSFKVMEEGERRMMFQDVLRKILNDKYAEEDPDFLFLSRNWFEKKTDAGIETVIEDLYTAAITTPWPLQWLKEKTAVLTEDREDLSPEERRQNEWCAPAVRALGAVTQQLIEQFNAKKRDKGVCDFSDLEHLALQILYEEDENGNHVRSEAAKELAQRFKYVMTDEYQDSNLIQEAVLHAVSGNEDGVYNRFMVGDVKQSIYGFRQARPDIFIEKYNTYVVDEKEDGEGHNTRIDLHTNYRSRPEVIDTVNLIFKRLMSPQLGGIDYDDAAALSYGGLYPEDEEKRPAELILLDKKSPDLQGLSTAEVRRIEAALVAERIKGIVGRLPVYDKETKEYRPCRYSDIAVLFQITSGVADLFARELNDQGIPSHTISKEGYFSAAEVRTVLSYLSILDNPLQDIPFAAVLFSPIADLSAQELAQIRKEDQETDYYHACLNYLENGPRGPIREKLQAFLTQYKALREKSVYTPVHELISDIFTQTGFRTIAAAMPAGEQRAANLDMLITKAKRFEQTSYHGLFNFIRYIERMQKYSVDEGEASLFSDTADTVRLMSIHKSKGLEFPVVFLCDTSHQFNVSDTSGRFLFHPELGIGLDVCDLEKHRIVPGIAKQRIADKKKEELYAEYERVLYVALTRAREKLYITAAEKDLTKLQDQIRELNPKTDEPLSKEILLEFNRFSAWLLLALHGAEQDCLKVRVETSISVEDKLSRHRRQEEGFFERLQDLDETAVYDEQTREILQDAGSFSYSFGMPGDIPGKMTVTQLKYLTDEMSEEEQGEVFEKEPVVIPYLPGFESGEEKKKITGARRGTIYHKVFEKIDYEELEKRQKVSGKQKAGEEAALYVKDLLAALKTGGILAETEADSIRPADIICFLTSPIGQRMKAAALAGHLKREQAFTFSIPANEADPAWPAQEDLLVQGIIDAFFLEDGAWVIVDYKTDFVPDGGASLVDKYGRQVYYYARALTAATGIPVKEKIIYSTYLGRSLPA